MPLPLGVPEGLFISPPVELLCFKAYLKCHSFPWLPSPTCPFPSPISQSLSVLKSKTCDKDFGTDSLFAQRVEKVRWVRVNDVCFGGVLCHWRPLRAPLECALELTWRWIRKQDLYGGSKFPAFPSCPKQSLSKTHTGCHRKLFLRHRSRKARGLRREAVNMHRKMWTTASGGLEVD